MKTAKKYIDELFSCEDCSDSVIIGSKKIFEDKLCTITSQYIDDGLPKKVAEEKAKNALHKYQNHIICSAIKTFADKYSKMVVLYKRAKISVIVLISVLFLCCLFLTTDDMTNKSVWIFIWVVVVIICAGVLLTMDYLRCEYRKSIFRLLEDTSLSKEHLEILGIDFDDNSDDETDEQDDEPEDEEDCQNKSPDLNENNPESESETENADKDSDNKN